MYPYSVSTSILHRASQSLLANPVQSEAEREPTVVYQLDPLDHSVGSSILKCQTLRFCQMLRHFTLLYFLSEKHSYIFDSRILDL